MARVQYNHIEYEGKAREGCMWLRTSALFHSALVVVGVC